MDIEWLDIAEAALGSSGLGGAEATTYIEMGNGAITRYRAACKRARDALRKREKARQRLAAYKHCARETFHKEARKWIEDRAKALGTERDEAETEHVEAQNELEQTETVAGYELNAAMRALIGPLGTERARATFQKAKEPAE